MSNAHRITMLGNPGSPYSRKMLALLRYRHIPYRVKWGDARNPPEFQGRSLPTAKPALLPTFYRPTEDGNLQATSDSTPLLRWLEHEYPDRHAIPSSPALAFINSVLEDFADEWCSKYMFHYRWTYAADIDKASTLIPYWIDTTLSKEVHTLAKNTFAERQISRLHVVGSNAATTPVIEDSYKRFVALLDQHLQTHRFLLGSRPASADFAIYGQLTQLVGVDPTPAAMALQYAPRVFAWVDLVEDLSGLEPASGDWISETAWPASLIAIFGEIGRGYLPAMLANAEAVQSGKKQWQADIGGHEWVQDTFPYQAKCLLWLREEYQALDTAARAAVDELLTASGCTALVTT